MILWTVVLAMASPAQADVSGFTVVDPDQPCIGPAAAPHCAVKTFHACRYGLTPTAPPCAAVGLPLTQKEFDAKRDRFGWSNPEPPWTQPINMVFGEGYIMDVARTRPVGYARLADARPPIRFATPGTLEFHIDAADSETAIGLHQWSFFLKQATSGDWHVMGHAHWSNTGRPDFCETAQRDIHPDCTLFLTGLAPPIELPD